MTEEFFRSRVFTRPVQPDPDPEDRVMGGTHDMTRQMVGEPALRAIYKRGAVRMPACPSCGIELGNGEDYREIVLGDNFLEQMILAGATATFRIHAHCPDVDRDTLLQRIVLAQVRSVLPNVVVQKEE